MRIRIIWVTVAALLTLSCTPLHQPVFGSEVTKGFELGQTRVDIPQEAEKAVLVQVAAHLKDPYSARLGGVAGFSMPADGPNKVFGVCGAVNAKNGFGGYTGFSPFAAQVEVTPDGRAVVVMVVVSESDDDSLWDFRHRFPICA